MANPLTYKARLFAEHYTIPGPTFHNATQSCIAVGYAEKNASVQGARLMKDERVLALIEEKRGQMEARMAFDRDRLEKELLDGLEWAKNEWKVSLDRNGKPLKDKDGLYRVTRSDNAIQGYLKMLGQMIGAFTDTVNVKTDADKVLMQKLAEARANVSKDKDPDSPNKPRLVAQNWN